MLQGRSQPVRLSDCRPRHKPFASGRPRGDSCAEVGKSILLVTASSESWKSVLERTAKQTPRVKGCFPSTLSTINITNNSFPQVQRQDIQAGWMLQLLPLYFFCRRSNKNSCHIAPSPHTPLSHLHYRLGSM